MVLGCALETSMEMGLQDIFMAGNMVTSRLFLNKGSFQFDDITMDAGLETTAWVHAYRLWTSIMTVLEDIYLSIGGLERRP